MRNAAVYLPLPGGDLRKVQVVVGRLFYRNVYLPVKSTLILTLNRIAQKRAVFNTSIQKITEEIGLQEGRPFCNTSAKPADSKNRY